LQQGFEVEKSPTILMVVAAALTDDEGRFLLQRRPAGKQHGGLWEFPGGKVETGETPRAALVREVNEELGIALDTCAIQPAAFADGAAASHAGGIVILLYSCLRWQGKPVATDGATISWFAPDEAARLAMPPLDIELLAQLSGGGG
jgi:8-oxo-dGTP diphosphatase